MVWVENMRFLHNVLNLLGNCLALSAETWLSQNEEIKGGDNTSGLGGLELNGEEEALDMGVAVCAGLYSIHLAGAAIITN